MAFHCHFAYTPFREFIAVLLLKDSESEVAQSRPTLCDPMDSSLHQAPPSMRFSRQEVLEWVAISFSRESSQPRDRTQVFHIVDRRFTVWATREGPMQALIHSVPPTVQQATANPHLCRRLLDTHRQVWVSLLWGHFSFLLTLTTSQLWLTWTEHHSIKLRSSWSKVKP